MATVEELQAQLDEANAQLVKADQRFLRLSQDRDSAYVQLDNLSKQLSGTADSPGPVQLVDVWKLRAKVLRTKLENMKPLLLQIKQIPPATFNTVPLFKAEVNRLLQLIQDLPEPDDIAVASPFPLPTTPTP